jgi:hypothetical protein
VAQEDLGGGDWMEGERNGDVADLTKGGMRVGFFFFGKVGCVWWCEATRGEGDCSRNDRYIGTERV